jgi:Flp pilus assembly protein TadD
MSRLIATYCPVAVMCGLLVACAAPSEPRTGQMNAQSREHIAVAAEASGNTDLALSMYAEAAAEAPGNSGIRLRYADMLVKNGKVDQARELLTRSLANASDPVEVRRGLGIINVMSGLNTQAITELDHVLTAHPQDVPALVDKAVALDLAGKHAEAQAIYRIAQGLTPDDPAIANNLALSLALEGRTSDARAVLLPFKGSDAIPERMKVTMKILDEAPNAEPDETGGDEVKRLAVALASLPRGSNDTTGGSDARQQ